MTQQRRTDDRAIGLLAKAPVPGTVKTRLAAKVGDAVAVALYRAMAADCLGAAAATAAALTLFFTPDDRREECELLVPAGVSARAAPQGSGDLGARLAAAAEGLLRPPVRRALLVGTDCPSATTADLEAAFGALEDHDLVVGPSPDGGYWLLGLRAPHPELFRDIPWSTSAVLERTLGAARELGLRIALVAERRDVDTLEDLERLRAEPEWDARAPRTAAALRPPPTGRDRGPPGGASPPPEGPSRRPPRRPGKA